MDTSPPPAPRLPIGFAHRGARSERRDNTIESFRRALELGAEALESDVWLTADGVAVLDHDGQVRRGLRRVPIGGLDRAVLPPHIPTLADLYRQCGTGFELSLDVKDAAAGRGAIDVAAGVGATRRLWLCGEGPQLAAWRAVSTDVRLVASTSPSRLAGGMGGGRFDAGAAAVAAAGADAVNLRWRDWTASLVSAVHAAGLLAFAWDTQQAATITGVLLLGVDGVYSDHVDVMTAAIEQWRRGSEPVDTAERPDPHEGPPDEQLP